MLNENQNGFFIRAWNGNIKLWQAVSLSVLGLICAFILSAIIGLATLWLKTNGIIEFNVVFLNKLVTALFVILFGIFTIRSIWKSASTPKLKIKHAIARFWAFLLTVYVVGVSFSLVVN